MKIRKPKRFKYGHQRPHGVPSKDRWCSVCKEWSRPGFENVGGYLVEIPFDLPVWASIARMYKAAGRHTFCGMPRLIDLFPLSEAVQVRLLGEPVLLTQGGE